MRARPFTLAVAAACIAVTAAGCGSSSSTPDAAARPSATPSAMTAEAYRSALKDVSRQEDAAQQQVQQAFQASTVAQMRTALSVFADDQRKAATELSGLRPPADAVTANTELAHAFSDNAAAIDALVAKLASAKSVKQAMSIVQSDQGGQQSGQEIDAALGKLKKLGYTSGS